MRSIIQQLADMSPKDRAGAVKLSVENAMKEGYETIQQPDVITGAQAESDLRKAFEAWKAHRPHWTDAFYEAYCAGVLDEKTNAN